MRIDKFLNTTNILKRRALAQEMIEHKLVSVNGAVTKASRAVKIGDIIEVRFLEYAKKYRVLALPQGKNIPKSEKNNFVEEMF